MTADEPPRPGESVWSRRLEGGPEFSLPLGWGPGQVLEAFWRDIFSRTPPGARVLEIGCGSGQVSLWAAEAGRRLAITATDVVDAPGAGRAHPDVTFVGGAPAEALPLPEAAFDLAVSNFALEYSDLERALPELARVMRPGGRGALVLHSAASTITGTSRLMIEVDAFLERHDVPGQVRRAAALRPDHLTRRKLLKQVAKLRAEAPAAVNPQFTGLDYFDIAERLLQGDRSAREDLDRLERVRPMRLEMAREQARAALDEAGFAELQRRLAALGLAVHPSRISCTYESGAEEEVGWIALLTRR